MGGGNAARKYAGTVFYSVCPFNFFDFCLLCVSGIDCDCIMFDILSFV